MKRTFDGVSKLNGYAANIRGEASDILQDLGRTVQDHVKSGPQLLPIVHSMHHF